MTTCPVSSRRPFAATLPARPAPDHGGGYGLAIARGIVEAHRGVIEVANHGLGCRFEVRLPPALHERARQRPRHQTS